MGKEVTQPLNLVMVSIVETVEIAIVEAGTTAIMTKGVEGTPEVTGEVET